MKYTRYFRMMAMLIVTLNAKGVVLAAESAVLDDGRDSAKPRDFNVFEHTVFIDDLRAGVHDPDGVNEYVIKYSVSAYEKPEQGKVREEKIAPEKSVTMELDALELKEIKALALVKFAGKERSMHARLVAGDVIRDAAAKCMQKLNLREEQVEIMVVVRLIESGKFLHFFGQDQDVGSWRFFPTSTDSEAPSLRPKGQFVISDSKGAVANFSVEYKAEQKEGKKS